MGTFHVLVRATGNHGCERDKKDGEHVVGCERPGCTDCITREFVRRLKKSGAQIHVAEIDHWPLIGLNTEGYTALETSPLEPTGQVQDNLVSGNRRGNF